MLSRIVAMLRKEFIQIRRDRRTLAMVLVMPVMQLLLFGYGINTVVNHLSMAVFDEAGDADSRALIAAFVNSSYFDVHSYVRSQSELAAAIDSGEAKVALHIPPDFGDRVLTGQSGQAQILIDGSDPNVASTASFAAGAVAQAAAAELPGSLLAQRSLAGASAAIDLRPVVLYNPSMLSVNFMVPGVIGLIMQFQTLLLTAFAVVRERERGTLEQLVVTPIRTWELMLGKILPYTLIASLASVFILIAGWLLFGVAVAGSLLLLGGLSVLFLLGSLGLGLLISTVSQTQAQAMQMAMFVTMPSILLSGFMYPRDTMPLVIQKLGLLVPLTYYLQILRGIMLKGVGLQLLWSNVLPLGIFSVAVFILSAWRFQKRVG
ncbi:MAG TPA: ABC transporter permease [Caldilineaceae bacterium]|nr:ABC transporter permease [Caldilineaceae bacterium]